MATTDQGTPTATPPAKPKTEKSVRACPVSIRPKPTAGSGKGAPETGQFLAKKAKQEAEKKVAAVAAPKEKAKKQEKAEITYAKDSPKGEKKILKPPDDLAYASYNPTVVGSAWYGWWEKVGFFELGFTEDGEIKPERMFMVPASPPNVMGALHVGHAFAIAV